MHTLSVISHYFFSATNFLFVLFLVLFFYTACSNVIITTKDSKASLLQTKAIPEFDNLSTKIGSVYAHHLRQSPESSGALLVTDGMQAFIYRTALARMAQKSIYLQSYIYKNDITSKIFMAELFMAANRGVQVRILIDDNGLDSDFSDIITLDSHPNIEVKIFNPYRNRNKFLRLPEMVFDYSRINRRMHNKIFIVDDAALIIGGRNVADNYFDNNKRVNFLDTDAVFIGAAALKAKQNFQQYWDYHACIPASLLPSKHTMKKYIKTMQENQQKIERRRDFFEQYDGAVLDFINQYQNKKLDFVWGRATFIADQPQKIEANFKERPITAALEQIFKSSKSEIYISSAYLVPGDSAMKALGTLQNKGVQLHILTNSLASTDSAVVYAAWERYRDEFLSQGVSVYEYQYQGKKKKAGFKGRVNSAASLHSKTIVFDQRVTWIGSFNLDPRSHNLNTESIIVFESEQFAKKVKHDIEEDIALSWKLQLQGGKTTWQGINKNGNFELHKSHPDAGIALKWVNFFAKVLPEDQI